MEELSKFEPGMAMVEAHDEDRKVCAVIEDFCLYLHIFTIVSTRAASKHSLLILDYLQKYITSNPVVP
jgi:hypothetical protein